MTSVLNADPSRTLLQRRQFATDMKRRWKRYQRELEAFILLLLGSLRFETDADKLSRFNAWVAYQSGWLLQGYNPNTGQHDDLRPWFYAYLLLAYRRGIARAYTEAKPLVGKLDEQIYSHGKESFLQQDSPKRRERLAFLLSRASSSYAVIIAYLAGALGRAFADGLNKGYSPGQLSKELGTLVLNTANKRADILAHDETVRATNEGILDGLEDLGASYVYLIAEWVTVAGPRATDIEMRRLHVCPQCREQSGQRYTIEQARGLLPLHARCRCCWALVKDAGEP